MDLELDRFNNYVISSGGSVIYSMMAMKFLKKNSVVVFLDAPFESIQKRLTNQETRGLVGLKKGLKNLFNERLILYKKYAYITIEMSDYSDISALGNPIETEKTRDVIEAIIKEIFREAKGEMKKLK